MRYCQGFYSPDEVDKAARVQGCKAARLERLERLDVPHITTQAIKDEGWIVQLVVEGETMPGIRTLGNRTASQIITNQASTSSSNEPGPGL